MKLIWLILSFFIYLSSWSAEAAMPYRILYPYGLLTEHYGILNNEVDLAVDTWRGIPHPYSEYGFNGGYPYWSCFPTSQTSIEYKTWRGEDGMDRADKIFSLCSLEFVVKTANEIHRYVERRADHIKSCKELIIKWGKITKNQDYVCFNAYDGEIVPNKTMFEIKRVKIWTWDRIKTKKGCLSYFDNYCNLEHWKKKYPNNLFRTF